MLNNAWTNQKIAVLGYGVEGQSTVNYFLRHGAIVEVHDLKPLPSLPSEIVDAHRQQGVTFITGPQAFGGLEHYDLVMRTPTFSPYHPALSQVSPQKISSQTKLFLTRWRDQTIGISGTKGKGTTATLIHHLLQKSGKKSLLGGNIGVPLLDIMDKMDSESIAVAELSNFQLWDVTVSPHIAVLLMVVPEHLEQHRELNDYLQAKQNLLKYQTPADKAVVLIDYNYTRQIAQDMPAKQWHISRELPAQGAVVQSDIIYSSTHPEMPLARLSDTVLRGSHNTQNLAGALIAASLVGVDLTNASAWLSDYRPLPHRLELVEQAGPLDFYDDSIATTPEAAIAGITSFTEPLVAILGGVNKQANWEGIAQVLTRANIRGAILVGDEAPRIKQAVEQLGLNLPILHQPESYDQAIPWAAHQLAGETKGVVLLSPGAKSFDQYQDYRDRGEKFTDAVRRFTTLPH